MYKGAVRWLIKRNVRALSNGDIGPLASSYASDATLVFPGTSSWAGVYRGRAEIDKFLRRFVSVGLQGSVEDVLVNGPPWRTRVCVLFTDRAVRAGTVVYENRAVLYACVRWGRITYQEDFEDTHKVEAFDRLLEAAGQESDQQGRWLP
jgi:ketosteroid isomerase-like protein